MDAEPSEFELLTLRHLVETLLPLVCSGSFWEFNNGSWFAVDYGTMKSLRRRGWIQCDETSADERRGPWILSDAGRKAFSDMRPVYERLAEQKRADEERRERLKEKRSGEELGRKGIYLAEHKGIWFRGLWWLG